MATHAMEHGQGPCPTMLVRARPTGGTQFSGSFRIYINANTVHLCGFFLPNLDFLQWGLLLATFEMLCGNLHGCSVRFGKLHPHVAVGEQLWRLDWSLPSNPLSFAPSSLIRLGWSQLSPTVLLTNACH